MSGVFWSLHLPLLRTARHSSDVLSSGYDMLLLAEEADEPKRALRKGIVGMEARRMVGLVKV